jgi:hypothetical protein
VVVVVMVVVCRLGGRRLGSRARGTTETCTAAEQNESSDIVLIRVKVKRTKAISDRDARGGVIATYSKHQRWAAPMHVSHVRRVKMSHLLRTGLPTGCRIVLHNSQTTVVTEP